MSSIFLQELSTHDFESKKLNIYFNIFLMINLCALCIAIYFTPPYDYNLFLLSSILSLAALIVWCHIKYKSLHPLPYSLTIGSLVFILFIAVSAIMSRNQKLALMYLIQLRFIVLSRLLYNAPLQDRSRKYVIIIFFISAILAGLVGIMQYFGFIQLTGDRSYGLSEHPITYALILAVAFSSAVIMLFIPQTSVFTSKKGYNFLLIVVLITFYGIVLSQTRGVWIALFTAPFITIFLYNRRRAILYLVCLIIMMAIIVIGSSTLIQKLDLAKDHKTYSSKIFAKRVSSIITSAYKEDVAGSTGNRLSLWKGALIIFKRYPLIGCGLGDYEINIAKLRIEGVLDPGTSAYLHAHNIYLQALATCGILGFMFMMVLFLSLIMWGTKRIRNPRGRGGYFIILITILYMVVGLTYSPHGDAMYMAASCLIVGLAGAYGAEKAAPMYEDGSKSVNS